MDKNGESTVGWWCYHHHWTIQKQRDLHKDVWVKLGTANSPSWYNVIATCTAWHRRCSILARKSMAASNWAVRNNTWKYKNGCWYALKWDSPKQVVTRFENKNKHITKLTATEISMENNTSAAYHIPPRAWFAISPVSSCQIWCSYSAHRRDSEWSSARHLAHF